MSERTVVQGWSYASVVVKKVLGTTSVFHKFSETHVRIRVSA